MKALPVDCFTHQSGVMRYASSLHGGTAIAFGAKPSAAACSLPCLAPSARHSESRINPRAAPAAVKAAPTSGGTKAAIVSFHLGLAPLWQARLTIGLQPPDMASASQGMVV